MKRRVAKESPTDPRARRSRAISIRGERHRADPALSMRGPDYSFEGRPASDALARGTAVSPRRPAPCLAGFSPFHGPV